MQRSLYDRLFDRLPEWAASILVGVILALLMGLFAVFGFLYLVADAWQHTVPPIPDGIHRGTQIVEALGVTVTWLTAVGGTAYGAIKAFRSAYSELWE